MYTIEFDEISTEDSQEFILRGTVSLGSSSQIQYGKYVCISTPLWSTPLCTTNPGMTISYNIALSRHLCLHEFR